MGSDLINKVTVWFIFISCSDWTDFLNVYDKLLANIQYSVCCATPSKEAKVTWTYVIYNLYKIICLPFECNVANARCIVIALGITFVSTLCLLLPCRPNTHIYIYKSICFFHLFTNLFRKYIPSTLLNKCKISAFKDLLILSFLRKVGKYPYETNLICMCMKLYIHWLYQNIVPLHCRLNIYHKKSQWYK